MEEMHPDKESYVKIWDTVIQKEIRNYQRIYGNYIQIIPNVEEEIWNKYVSLNNYCKNNYMKFFDGKIDRHKVAACYMIAIATIRPMRIVKKIDGDTIPLAINEMLAITVGLSLVRAFAISVIKQKEKENKIDKAQADILVAKYDEKIKMPSDNLVNHGDYLTNYSSEIYFAVSEGNINILSIAHELYLLEVLTRTS